MCREDEQHSTKPRGGTGVCGRCECTRGVVDERADGNKSRVDAAGDGACAEWAGNEADREIWAVVVLPEFAVETKTVRDGEPERMRERLADEALQ